MGTGSYPGVRCGQGVTLITHSFLVPRSKMSRAITLLSLRAFVAYGRVKTTYLECGSLSTKHNGKENDDATK
jgi:hypothetical protein